MLLDSKVFILVPINIMTFTIYSIYLMGEIEICMKTNILKSMSRINMYFISKFSI